jgi:hypothetical protein
MFDARSGGDPFANVEGGPAPCGGPERLAPRLVVPMQAVSVPWPLGARDPDGYSATVDAQVRSCDGYARTLDADLAGAVRVLVSRPFGPPCGSPQSVPMTLFAATVTGDLPAPLLHAPLGPYESLTSGTPYARQPGPPIIYLQTADNGKSFAVVPRTVFVVVAGMRPAGYPAAMSSNPAVVGLIEPQIGTPASEFRAWRPGAARLSIPGGWVVRVNVT